MINPQDLKNIPLELKSKNQWVCYILRPTGKTKPNGKPKTDKLPINPHTGKAAATDNPSTWGSFDQALTHALRNKRVHGLGFVLTKEAGIVGVDWDDCVIDGRISPVVLEDLQRLDSYTEYSPSGDGVRAFAWGEIPEAVKRPHIELYDWGRFLTVTGRPVEGFPFDLNTDAQEVISDIWQREKGSSEPEQPAERPPVTITLDEGEILHKALNASNGAKFERLWNGDATGYPSESEADFALACILAFWTQDDPAAVARLLCKSGLYRPKFDQRHSGKGLTYAELTAHNAVKRNRQRGAVYNPQPSQPARPSRSYPQKQTKPTGAAVAYEPSRMMGMIAGGVDLAEPLTEVQENAYDRLVSVHALYLRRALIRNPAIYMREAQDEKFIRHLRATGAEFAAYPLTDMDGSPYWFIFSNVASKHDELITIRDHAGLCELVYDAVDTPDGRAIAMSEGWGAAASPSRSELVDIFCSEDISGHELASQLWPGLVTFPVTDAGVGLWPPAPKSYKRALIVDKAAVTLETRNQQKIKLKVAARRVKAPWRLNERELFFRARSECRMAHAEASLTPMYYEVFTDIETAEARLKTFKNRVKENRKAGKDDRLVWTLYTYEVDDVLNFAITHNHQKEGKAYGQPLPLARSAAMKLFTLWADTPEDYAIRRSKCNYGGIFNNMKGDGRKAAAAAVVAELDQEAQEVEDQVKRMQLVMGEGLEDINRVASICGVMLNDRLYGERELDAGQLLEVFEDLQREFPEMKTRFGRGVMREFFRFVGITPPNVDTTTPDNHSTDVKGGSISEGRRQVKQSYLDIPITPAECQAYA